MSSVLPLFKLRFHSINILKFSFYHLLFILVFVIRIQNTYAQGVIPRLELEKTVFALSEKEIPISYEGAPTALDITLTGSDQKELFYLAVLRKVNEKDRLVIVLNSAPPAGTYHLSVKKDSDTLINTDISWQAQNSTTTPTTRTMDTYVFPNEIQSVDLTFQAPQSGFYTVTEAVPFNAIILNTDAATIKDPELLGLSQPFEGDYELTLPYGVVDPEIHFGIPLHDGLDFALPSGTPLFAVDNGEIVPYREVNQYGTTIAIQHGWGQTFYGHLSKTALNIGDKVRRGQLIGYSGNTGLSSGPHLHFGMKWEDTFVDPLPFLSSITDAKSTSKQLRWRIQGDQNQQIKIHYSYILPSDFYGVDDKPTFGLLHIVNEATNQQIQEAKPTTLTLGQVRENEVDIRNQIKLSYDKAAHELTGLDLITNTPFTQELKSNEPNYITLNSLKYEIQVDEKDEVSLKLTQ